MATVFGSPTFGNAKALVSFSAADSLATSFRATSTPNSRTADNALSPILMQDLDGNTDYTCTVHAIGDDGNSAESSASATFTTGSTSPDQPAAPTVTPGDTEASVAYVAPATGGATITSFNVRTLLDGNATGQVTSGISNPIVVTGLTNLGVYSFTLQAVNSVGVGFVSDPSVAVIPISPVPPNAPTIGTASPGNGQVEVTFTPAVSGNPPVTFTATASPGGATATGSASPLIVTGLPNGISHTITVHATNVYGNSSESSSSNSVTPLSTLTNPFVTGVVLGALRGDYSNFVGIKFTVGGSPITVKKLGRWVVAGNSGTHTVKLADASGVDLAGGSVSINTSGATAGAFSYADLASPIVLSAGATYFLGSLEAASGDQWYDQDNSLTCTALATIIGAAFVNFGGAWTMGTVSSTAGFGPVNFRT